MKYLLFAGPTYYAGGGITDYVGSYESIDAAKADFAKRDDCNDWAHIVDHESMKAVCEYQSGDFKAHWFSGWRAPR